MKNYDVLIVRGTTEQLEQLASVGEIFPITGLLEGDGELSLYFDDGGLTDDLIANLKSWIDDDGVTFERGEIKEQNWNLEFEQSLQPVRITDSLIITQSWNRVEAGEDELVIIIDPKMSFGTGHHESTRLIAKLMESISFSGLEVLDAGTGTGSLAIIAAKRGADRVVAFDNNEWAVENTEENVNLNDVDNQIDIRLCELEDVEEGPFDVILANLHRNLIIRLLPGFVERLAGSDSLLLTSGVLFEDYESLVDAAREHGLKPIAEERENEWIATTFGFAEEEMANGKGTA